MERPANYQPIVPSEPEEYVEIESVKTVAEAYLEILREAFD